MEGFYRQPPWMSYEMDELMDWVEEVAGEAMVQRLLHTYLGIIEELEGGPGPSEEERINYYNYVTQFEAHLKAQWEAANGPWTG